MKVRRICCIGLSMRVYPAFADKVAEAVRLLEHAAKRGAELVIFPETINLFRGDGPDSVEALSIGEAALSDWSPVEPLLQAARRLRVALVLPLFWNEGGKIFNVAFLFDESGRPCGSYRKIFPTPEEMADGVSRGGWSQPLMEWNGLKIGGAICFDTQFEEVFAAQAARGAELFVVPSLWPGGTMLNAYALKYQAVIAMAYPAWSRIIGIDGNEIAGHGERSETLRFHVGMPMIVADINFDRQSFHLSTFAAHWTEIERRYGDRIETVFDQPNCLVYLESRCPDLTVEEIKREYRMLNYGEYIASCREIYRKTPVE